MEREGVGDRDTDRQTDKQTDRLTETETQRETETERQTEMLYVIISTENNVCSQRQMHTCIHHSVIHYEHTNSK